MPILGNCKKLLKSTEITQKLSIKICFWEDDRLILWLKGLRSGGIELQSCLSRYLHRVPSSVYNIQPHPGGYYSEAQKVLLSFSSNATSASLKFIMINLILYKS